MKVRLRKYLILFSVVFLIVFGVRELLGQGFYSVGGCVKEFKLNRCLGLGVSESHTLVDDIYDLTRQGITSKTPKELLKAHNLIRERFAESKAEINEDKPLTRSQFMKFWSMEVQDFTEFSRERVPRSSGIDGWRLTHCYSRKKAWLNLPENQNIPPSLCTVNYFELHPNPSSITNPYNWRVEKIIFNECSVTDINLCEEFNNSLDKQ